MPHPQGSNSRLFGTLRTGGAATLWTLRGRGIEIDVTDLGATLVALRVPDRRGEPGDVVLGFGDAIGYQSGDNAYLGCTVGRVGNRIARGRFTLDGVEHRLACNDGQHHLHGGGARSLDRVPWRATPGPGFVRFAYDSPHGEEGYPGNLSIEVSYALPDDAEGTLVVSFTARTDRRTPVNLTHHSYWNLAGAGAPSVLDHTLWIDASHYTPTDEDLIPTGEIAEVAGTPLDFRTTKALRPGLAALLAAGRRGYDDNLVLRPGAALRHCATLHDPGSGRTMHVDTTEPGLQLYTGNFLRGQRGKAGLPYAVHGALCLEPQHFPDSVHHPHFPSTILAPGAIYASTTRFRFTCR